MVGEFNIATPTSSSKVKEEVGYDSCSMWHGGEEKSQQPVAWNQK